MKYYEIPQNSETTQSKVLLGQALPLKRKDELIYLKSNNVQFSCVRLFATPWIAARQACLSITNSRSSLKLMSIESVMPSSHLILCCPLLLLPPLPPQIRVFSNESTLHKEVAKYWSFSFSIIPSKEHPGLISFRMDWLDLLAENNTNAETSVWIHQKAKPESKVSM